MSQPYDILQILFDTEEDLLFMDIGACEGMSSVGYLGLFPKAQAHLFEPLEGNVHMIHSNLKKGELENRCKVHMLCLSNKKGIAGFNVSSGHPPSNSGHQSDQEWNKSSSLLDTDKVNETYDWLRFEERISVPTETLAAIMKSEDIGTVHFIHMDVQGAELLVLEGAGARLKDVHCIWLEVATVEIYTGQPLKKEIHEFMKAHDFECILHTGDGQTGDEFWISREFLATKDDGHIKRLRSLGRKSAREQARLEIKSKVLIRMKGLLGR